LAWYSEDTLGKSLLEDKVIGVVDIVDLYPAEHGVFLPSAKYVM
jgi:hypothetical protein